jgi:hypothetical protein
MWKPANFHVDFECFWLYRVGSGIYCLRDYSRARKATISLYCRVFKPMKHLTVLTQNKIDFWRKKRNFRY